MSLMSISVSERRKEIGVRRSVGAARSDIIVQFLFEAALVSLAGGTLGVVAGWAGMQVATRLMHLPSILVWQPFVILILLSIALGIVFGIYPAWNASKVATSPIGRRIMINRVAFTVTGVLAERGQGLDVANEDIQIYVPLATAMRRLMNTDHSDGIVIEISSFKAMDAAAALHSFLRQLHHLRPEQRDDFQVQNQKTLLETQRATASRLGFFLRWIALSTLAAISAGHARDHMDGGEGTHSGNRNAPRPGCDEQRYLRANYRGKRRARAAGLQPGPCSFMAGIALVD
jgi:ABC-type antimicrobial peptide transport system permease subunit